jgi:hypothetical protein
MNPTMTLTEKYDKIMEVMANIEPTEKYSAVIDYLYNLIN